MKTLYKVACELTSIVLADNEEAAKKMGDYLTEEDGATRSQCTVEIVTKDTILTDGWEESDMQPFAEDDHEGVILTITEYLTQKESDEI